MNQFRLEQLRNFYEEEPNDPFNAYALATELLKFDLQAARQLFEELLVNTPIIGQLIIMRRTLHYFGRI
jgi:lipoprotein NlpI